MKKFINTSLDLFYDNPKYFTCVKTENITILDIDKFIQSNKVNDENNVLLFKLVANNEYEQLKSLLSSDKNIDVNVQDKDGDTPLHIAIFTGNLKIIKLLLQTNADTNIVDKWGQTPIHRLCFCFYNSNVCSILNLLIRYKVKFNTQDNYGNTPLHLIIKHISKMNCVIKKSQINFLKKIKIHTSLDIKNNENQNIIELVSSIPSIKSIFV